MRANTISARKDEAAAESNPIVHAKPSAQSHARKVTRVEMSVARRWRRQLYLWTQVRQTHLDHAGESLCGKSSPCGYVYGAQRYRESEQLSSRKLLNKRKMEDDDCSDRTHLGHAAPGTPPHVLSHPSRISLARITALGSDTPPPFVHNVPPNILIALVVLHFQPSPTVMAPPKKPHVQEELPPPELSHSVCVAYILCQGKLTAVSCGFHS